MTTLVLLMHRLSTAATPTGRRRHRGGPCWMCQQPLRHPRPVPTGAEPLALARGRSAWTA